MRSFSPWKVLHLDLSKGLSALPYEQGIGGLYLVFWWHDIPLGQQEISATQLPLTLSHLREMALKIITPAVGDHLLEVGFKALLPIVSRMHQKAKPPDFNALIELVRPLEKLRMQSALPPNGCQSCSVSIVVCTRNRTAQLEFCLRSLKKLTQTPEEIVVVDNDPSSEATRMLVEKIPEIKYVRESRPGLSAARNAGIRHCQGDIIAFTDDDVAVHPDWIARLQQGFQNPKVLAVTGLVLPAELETESQFVFQQGHGNSGWGYRTLQFDNKFFKQMKNRGVPVWQIGAGANMAFHRNVFEVVGGFDERLGAGAGGCSEDSEMWYRLLAEGWVCRYEPTAIVFHCHRREMKDLQRQMFQYMRGHMVALLVQFENYRHWGNLYRAFGILPRYYTKLLLKHAFKAFRSEERLLGAQILGCAAGVMFYLKHKRRVASC